MSKPLLGAIHHVALICSDYPRSRAFYSETLGLPIVHEVYREARDSWKCDLLVSPGVQLELFPFPNHQRDHRARRRKACVIWLLRCPTWGRLSPCWESAG